MPITNEVAWNNYVEKNKDSYGNACITVARKVMELLDTELGPIDAHQLICKADDDTNTGGITGFMAGCVAQMIMKCHSRGEEFKKAWNKFWGAPEDAENTVNPAIITIDTDK